MEGRNFFSHPVIGKNFQLVHSHLPKGIINLLNSWGPCPVIGNRTKAPEVYDWGDGGIESTAGLLVRPLGVREQFMEERRDGKQDR